MLSELLQIQIKGELYGMDNMEELLLTYSLDRRNAFFA